MAMEKAIARCRCGEVEIEFGGAPIASLICHCDDCQAGSALLAALPGNGPIVDSAGGTGYVTWRKDRMRVLRGQALLDPIRLRDKSATARRYARCCHTPMVATFDDARHWVTVYRDCIAAPVPSAEWRIMTRFVADKGRLPRDVPAFARFPFAMIRRLLASRIAMALSRRTSRP